MLRGFSRSLLAECVLRDQETFRLAANPWLEFWKRGEE